MDAVKNQVIVAGSNFSPESLFGRGCRIYEEIGTPQLPVVSIGDFALEEFIEDDDWTSPQNIVERVKRREGFICFGLGMFFPLWFNYLKKGGESFLEKIGCDFMAFVRESVADAENKDKGFPYLMKHKNTGKWSWNLSPVNGSWSRGFSVAGYKQY